MKSKIIVKCSCGKEWSDDNTPERSKYWWNILDIVSPEIGEAIDKSKDGRTLEMVFRLMWARHSFHREEVGDKKKHETTITEEVIIESLEEAEKIINKYKP